MDFQIDIEALTPETAPTSVKAWLEQSAKNVFRIGGGLHLLKTHRKWSVPEWRDYARDEFDLSYRSAMNYIAVFQCVTQPGLDQARLSELSYTKLVELTRYGYLKPSTQDEAIEAANTHSTPDLAVFVHEKVKPYAPAYKSEKFTITCTTEQKERYEKMLDTVAEQTGLDGRADQLDHILDAYTSAATSSVDIEALRMKIHASIKATLAPQLANALSAQIDAQIDTVVAESETKPAALQ